MIYCTRKISKTKYNNYEEITFCKLKYYSIDVYKKALEKVSFPNYDRFDNPDVAYNNFIDSNFIINAVAPIKTTQVNGSME